jgi:8-oxo-dGTP pyrophosphatase MutT (NUDIX family)
MLHLIPKPVYRFLLRHAHRARVVWWRWAKPRTRDCRVIALDGEGRVLLVRHSYGTYGWMLPGGRPGRGEDPVAAGARELYEETGCGLARGIEILGPDPAAHRLMYVVVGKATGVPRADDREIVEARFCALDALPEPVSDRLAGQLRAWIARYHEGMREAG